MAITAAFDRTVQGWTSLYSFIPDSSLSLNNNYYTLKQGTLWVHNSDNAFYNTFYNVYYPTTMTFIMNDESSKTKNFKTLALQAKGEWSAFIETNLENGTITEEQFEDKEGNLVAFIRGEEKGISEEPDLKSSSVGGIGTIVSITDNTKFDLFPGQSENGDFYTGTTYNFPQVPSNIAVGDLVYLAERGGNTGTYDQSPKLVGRVGLLTSTGITVHNFELDGASTQSPVTGELLFYAKNTSAEKSGILGFYAIVTLTNDQTISSEVPLGPNEAPPPVEAGASEIYSAESEVFLSSK